MNLKKLNDLSIASKIVIAMVILFLTGEMIVTFTSVNKMEKVALTQTKNGLSIVTDSIFITLRDAMNTGDPQTIANAEKESKDIKGVHELRVHKSKALLELFGSTEKTSYDSSVSKVFTTKKDIIIDFYEKDKHFLRSLKPMIATTECIACHANQKTGDVIGVIDISFPLTNTDIIIKKSSNFLLIISIAITLLSAMLIFLLTKKATAPLHHFHNGLNEFFAYINKERDDITKLQVYSNDEIGQMTHAVNKNIRKTILNIKTDSEFINEVKALVDQMKSGKFNTTITSNPSTKELVELKSLINDVVLYIKTQVSEDINDILYVLDKFANHDYTHKAQYKAKVSSSLNDLSEIISKMLYSNKRLGLVLEQNSNELTKNVDVLAKSANIQASNLEETAAQIQEITDNLNSTSSKTISMTNLANKVKESSKLGIDLAHKNANSIEEINESTASIRDSVDAIDQIAFQTNILSLNAAVEAATAGEAGKGFAVVAGEVRNLANRSAEAASEIKRLVDEASQKASEGKNASDSMIEGYTKLNERIAKTLELIDDVASNSNEQINTINSLNESMGSLDLSTQQNAEVANETNEIAIKTNKIAKDIVKQTEYQKFDGKNNIKLRKKVFDPNYSKENDRRSYTKIDRERIKLAEEEISRLS